jgi:ATP-dependent exoDNAse (exonuclease V) alpha subunit
MNPFGTVIQTQYAFALAYMVDLCQSQTLCVIIGDIKDQLASVSMKKKAIELNPEFQRALDIMERTDKCVFVTGRAGTGKSTLLEYFRSVTQKKVAVLAPTGVAALNVKGQTIHSFFRFKPGITVDKIRKRRDDDDDNSIYQELNAIVIDEISMVRADLLDCVDAFLRLNGPDKRRPFGGIQMVFIGDLYQLPPVVKGDEKTIFNSLYETPYFFSAHVMSRLEMEFVELEKIYRQHDEHFISLLNAIRNNSVTDESLALLNERCLSDFTPPPEEYYIYLTTTNALAEGINREQLERLDGDLYTLKGRVSGELETENLPTAIELKVKVGAQIMLLNNDSAARWVNGSVGRITAIDTENNDEPVVIVRLSGGYEVEVTPYTWEVFRFFIEDGKLETEVTGTFRQYPLMLAWAVTIHKGQGKTFEKVVIDIGRGTFAHGQMYVALSRCTSLEGIILKKPIRKNHIWMDWKVVKFLTKFQYDKAALSLPVDEKIALIEKAIRDRTTLKITYLKPNDEKSQRIIAPKEVGEMEYNSVKYTGLKAYCYTRRADRTFRVDRILKIEELKDKEAIEISKGRYHASERD